MFIIPRQRRYIPEPHVEVYMEWSKLPFLFLMYISIP